MTGLPGNLPNPFLVNTMSGPDQLVLIHSYQSFPPQPRAGSSCARLGGGYQGWVPFPRSEPRWVGPFYVIEITQGRWSLRWPVLPEAAPSLRVAAPPTRPLSGSLKRSPGALRSFVRSVGATIPAAPMPQLVLVFRHSRHCSCRRRLLRRCQCPGPYRWPVLGDRRGLSSVNCFSHIADKRMLGFIRALKEITRVGYFVGKTANAIPQHIVYQ